MGEMSRSRLHSVVMLLSLLQLQPSAQPAFAFSAVEDQRFVFSPHWHAASLRTASPSSVVEQSAMLLCLTHAIIFQVSILVTSMLAAQITSKTVLCATIVFLHILNKKFSTRNNAVRQNQYNFGNFPQWYLLLITRQNLGRKDITVLRPVTSVQLFFAP